MGTPGSGPWPAAVEALAHRLDQLDWVFGLYVAGSLATGDYRPGVSDLDLVALTGTLTAERVEALGSLHRELDRSNPARTDLGCGYVDGSRLAEGDAKHPTWTHGNLVTRALSPITRAELARHGRVVFGRPVAEVFPPISDDEVRGAARAELTGYWRMAARRPWWWLDPTIADLGLTAMARSRHAMARGQLMTKSVAIDQARAPAWLREDLRARRNGLPVVSPRVRTAWIAWRDAWRTTHQGR